MRIWDSFGGKTFFLFLVRNLFAEVSEFPKGCISHAIIFLSSHAQCSDWASRYWIVFTLAFFR